MNYTEELPEPCEVCGKDVDACICPVCPKCSWTGKPQCYRLHGLVRTEEQKASFKEAMRARHCTEAHEKTRIEALITSLILEDEE